MKIWKSMNKMVYSKHMQLRVFGSLGASLLMMGASLNPITSLATTAVTAAAQTKWADPAPIQNVLNNIVQNEGGLGALAEVRDTYRGTFVGTAGVSNPDTQAPVDANAHFRIASDSKLFVAVAILQLQAAGELSLDDTIDEYFTQEEVPNNDKITIRMLLNHTSGLAEFSDEDFVHIMLANPQKTWTPEELLQFAEPYINTPLAAPGAAYYYSNTNYLLAAMIIEQTTDEAYGNYITDNIINKLGLTDTSVPSGTDLPAPNLKGYYGTTRKSDGTVVPNDATNYNATYHYGYGQLISTAHDMNSFYQALFGGQLLAPAQMNMLRTVVPQESNTFKDYYGMGVGRVELRCGITVWGHNGSLPGYQGSTYISDNGQRVYTLMYSSAQTRNNAPYNEMLDAVFCQEPLVSVSNPADGPGSFTLGRLTHYFFKANNGHMIWARQQQPGGAWERLDKGGALASNPVVVTESFNHLRAFAQGTNKHLLEMDLNDATSVWVDSGVSISSSPSIVTNSIGHYDIFARASDNSQLLHITFDGTTWHNELVPGASGVWSNPVVYSDHPGDLHVAYRHYNDGRVNMAYTTSSGAWKVSVIGTTAVVSSVAIVSYGPGSSEIYGRSSNNHLQRAAYTPGTGWKWTDLGGGIITNPTLFVPKPDDVHVFALGTNKALYERTSSAWVSRGGILGGTPNALITRQPSTVSQGGYLGRVIAPGTNGYFYELRSNNGSWGTWSRTVTL